MSLEHFRLQLPLLYSDDIKIYKLGVLTCRKKGWYNKDLAILSYALIYCPRFWTEDLKKVCPYWWYIKTNKIINIKCGILHNAGYETNYIFNKNETIIALNQYRDSKYLADNIYVQELLKYGTKKIPPILRHKL